MIWYILLIVPIVAFVIGYLLIRYEANNDVVYKLSKDARKEYLIRAYSYQIFGLILYCVALISFRFFVIH